MTGEKASLATGAAPQDDALRKRNVEAHKETNGSISVSKVEVDDKKDKKVCGSFEIDGQSADSSDIAFHASSGWQSNREVP